MAEKRINEYFRSLPENSSPSSTTYLVVEENGVTKKIPINLFIHKDDSGNAYVSGLIDVTDGATFGGPVDIKYGEYLRLHSEDNTKYTDIYCDDEGNLIGKEASPIATEKFVTEKVANISSGGSSAVSGYYDCTTNPGTSIKDLINDLTSKGYTFGDTMVLTLHRSQSGGQSGRYIGYIETWAGDTACKFYFLEITTATLYSNEISTNKNLVYAFEEAKTELAGGITEEELEKRLAELADSTGGSSTYIYEAQDSTATMRGLINYLQSQGYISDTIMLLQLAGGMRGSYVGAINFFSNNEVCSFNLFDVTTATLFSHPNGISTSTTIVDALENATKTELGGIAETPEEYVTEEELEAKGYLTSVPSEYVTEAELNGKGYAKTSDIPSLDGYAKTTDLFSKDYNDLTNKPTIPSIEGLASEDYVRTYIESVILGGAW